MILRKFFLFAILVNGLSNSLSCNEIIIQPDYWTGTKTLENGIPWQVPASIYKEDEFCTQDDIALEFGSGGSTIFLAKRCKYVVSIETNPHWAKIVQDKLNELNITNVSLVCLQNQADIEQLIQFTDLRKVSILSVDTVLGYNRSAFLRQCLQKGISENLKMIVLDNYGCSGVFPEHYNKDAVDLSEWLVYIYDDEHWGGKGTKIYVRKPKL